MNLGIPLRPRRGGQTWSILEPVNLRQITVREAFDRHADTYDDRFSNCALGESIRNDVWTIADRVFTSSRRLLDLGSGTGEDAIHFAGHGVEVTGVDISDEMQNRLEAKALACGVSGNIHYVRAEMSHFDPAGAEFDGIISNFGAVNCVADLGWLTTLCRQSLKPGSPIVLITMGVLYPLESLTLLLTGQLGSVFRRLKSPCMVSVEGVSIPVYYHSLGKMRRMLGRQFHLEQVAGLRAFLPVPGWEHLNRSKVMPLFGPLDRLWCRSRWTASYADHFVSVWRYRP